MNTGEDTSMNRVQFFMLLAAIMLLCSAPLNVVYAQELTPAEARSIAKEAYIFGAAYVNNYRVYLKGPVDKTHVLPVKFNEFLHLRKLVGPEIGDTPNNDALFSYAILDLRREPVVISVPQVPKDRLYMLQMGEVNTETLPYISSIATGTDAGDYVIVGPDYTGYLPAKRFSGVIASRGQFIAVTGRTAINGKEDLPRVSAIQDGYKITPLSRFLRIAPPPPATPVNFLPWDKEKAAGIGFFDYFNMTFAWQLPTLDEMPMLARFARIGVVPGERFTTQGMSAQVVAALEEGIKDAKQAIAQRSATSQRDTGGGWEFGTDDISRFGRDYLLRAAISVENIYPNSPDHALYARARKDISGKPLSGKNQYTIKFGSKELPPVNGFWSLTMYDSRTTAMVPNTLDRYSIGDRTKGLVYDADGSLRICVQRHKPESESCNWLPAPEGEFYLILRLYAPKQEVIKEGWVPPAITAKQ
jgi:hypothetical protein